MNNLLVLEWEWWLKDETPVLIEAHIHDIVPPVYLNSNYIKTWLQKFQPGIYALCLTPSWDELGPKYEFNMDVLKELLTDKDQIVSDMVHYQTSETN